MFIVPRTTPGVGSHGILIAGHQMVQGTPLAGQPWARMGIAVLCWSDA